MDHQRLTYLTVLIMAAGGCTEDPSRAPAFDGPTGSAVLAAEQGPFDEPVGFVANSRSGTIVPLDLKHGIFLADQLAAPFLRSRWIATGDERQLDQLAVWAPDQDSVSVYATDLAHGVLVEAPYVVNMGNAPELPDLSATDPVFEDVDGSGDSSTLTDIELRHGYTTTEEWTLEHDGSRWWVTGTRSGKQERIPEPGEPYWTDRRELSFIVDGTASEGDRLTLATDSGVVEHDLGGTIVGMAQVPDEALLIAGTWDGTAGAIAVFDLVTDQVRGILEFGESQAQ